MQFVCLLTLMQGNGDIVEHSYDNAVKMWYYIHGFSVNAIGFTIPSMIRIFVLVHCLPQERPPAISCG